MQFAVVDPSVSEFYSEKNGTGADSGFDLYLPDDVFFPSETTVFVRFGVSAKTVSGSGFWLLPRSSISKTPLRFANSVGLIDPDYRGSLIAAVWNPTKEAYHMKKGTRIAQVCLPSLMPFRVEWIENLNETLRGSGGFGSTG
jgi:dUTP pyrophosphatase